MKWPFWIFVGLYGAALLLFLIGTFGWFGQDQDPLAGVFLLPLALPWSMLADRMGAPGLPSVLLAPAVNAGILFWLWKR